VGPAGRGVQKSGSAQGFPLLLCVYREQFLYLLLLKRREVLSGPAELRDIESANGGVD
jgi:hypothetical protein